MKLWNSGDLTNFFVNTHLATITNTVLQKLLNKLGDCASILGCSLST